ncbi:MULTISPECIES: cytochrome b562 [unclassified Pseudoalteromonas]|uniref:cytochrome b562 n=1 Tax=unclassified Pseudoalteromonas TaxID=194690 RepID=UPI001F16FFD3|nr:MULTISPECIES: cytochrome b562 [unclassified Pseudoalteromonas]
MRLVFTLFLSAFIGMVSVQASAQQSIDLEAVMKKMGHSYKQAVKAEDQGQMLMALDELQTLVEQAKQARFNKEPEQSLQGLDKVLEQISLARTLAKNNELAEASVALKSIDSLRKEYHELHEPPGLWQLLFGQ